MALDATYTKKITVTTTEQELLPVTFANNNRVSACLFDAFKTATAVANLLVRFRDSDEWFPWPTTELLPLRAQSIYVKMSTGSADVIFLARIVGIQMTDL